MSFNPSERYRELERVLETWEELLKENEKVIKEIRENDYS